MSDPDPTSSHNRRPRNLDELRSFLKNGYVSLDLETTGTSPKKDQIIQIGAQRYDASGKPVGDKLSVLVRTDREIPAEITKLTGIDRSSYRAGDVIDQKDIPSVLGGYIQGLPVMAFNAGFETTFLRKTGMDIGHGGIIDPMVMARAMFRRERGGKLENLTNPNNKAYGAFAQKWGIQRQGQAHTAYSDAEVTNQLLWAMIHETESNPDAYKHLGQDPLAGLIQRGTLTPTGPAAPIPVGPSRGGIQGPPPPPIGGNGGSIPPIHPPGPPSPSPIGNFHGARIRNDINPEELVNYLSDSKTGLGDDYKVNVSTGAPKGYTRLVITNDKLGFRGQQAMTLDVRGGAWSASGTPAFMVRTSGAEVGSEIAIGSKLAQVSNAETGRRDWQFFDPNESLRDVIQASFLAADIRTQNERAMHGDRKFSPTNEVYSVLTEGDERHQIARDRFLVPSGHLSTTHYSSEGEQAQAARTIGVYFGLDPKSKDTPWMQAQQQREEINERLLHGTGFWKDIFQRGLYSFTKGEDRSYRLSWMTDTRSVMQEGTHLIQRLALAWTAKGETYKDQLESTLKHVKQMSAVGRSRSGPEFMEEQMVELDKPGGDTYKAKMYVPVEPISIEEAQSKYGERYFEAQERERKKIIVKSGIVEPGEQHRRSLVVAQGLATKTPFAGAALVDQSITENTPDQAFPKNIRQDLPQIETLQDLLALDPDFKNNVTGTNIPALHRGQRFLGQFNLTKKTKEGENTESIDVKVGSQGYDMQLRGGVMHIPAFYDEEGKLYTYGIERGGRYWADDNQTELFSTADIANTLEQKLQGTGIRVETSSQGGSYLMIENSGLIGGSFKTPYMKPGTSIHIGSPDDSGKSRRMYLEDNGQRMNVDLATGEVKQAVEMMKGSFRVLSFENRLNMLSMIGDLHDDVTGKTYTDVGQKLAEFSAKRFGDTEENRKNDLVNTIVIDELEEELRRITGNNGLNWSDIFSAMHMRVQENLKNNGQNKSWLNRLGYRIPVVGSKLYMGLVDKALANNLNQLAAENGGENPFIFEDYKKDPKDQGDAEFADMWQVLTKANESLMLPLGMEVSTEFPGQAKKLNLESIASLSENFPNLSKELGASLEQGPGAGRPSKAQRAWLGVLKAYSMQLSAGEAEVQHEGNLQIGPKEAALIRNALINIDPKGEDKRLKAVNKILTNIWKEQSGSDSLSDQVTARFLSSDRYMPIPEHARGIDIMQGKESKGHFISQYLRAMQELADYEVFGESGASYLEAHNRFLGTMGRIPTIVGKGADLVKKLTSRQIDNTTSGHYFFSTLLGPGMGLLPEHEFERTARTMGLKTKEHIYELKDYLINKWNGILPGALQRYPVVDKGTGSIPLYNALNFFFKHKLGVKMPGAKSLRGMMGLSIQSSLGLEGDEDNDPHQFTSGVTVDKFETVEEEDENGKIVKTRVPVFSDESIKEDFRNKDIRNPKVYTDAVQTTMRHMSNKMNILKAAVNELMDPNENVLKSAKRMKWIPAETMMDSVKFWWDSINGGGLMNMRGIAYNIKRETEAVLSGRMMDKKAYENAMRSFALQYQQTLEANTAAGQESNLAAIINKATIQLPAGQGGKMVLKTQIRPGEAWDKEDKPAWPVIMNSAGQGKDKNGEESAWAGYSELIHSIADEANTDNNLLAAMIASYGEKEGDYEKNRETILKALNDYSDPLQKQGEKAGTAPEQFAKDIAMRRWSKVLQPMLGKEVGQYNPLSTLMMSSALEKMARGTRNGEFTGFFKNAAIPWRGEWYSPADLFETDEFQNLVSLRSLLTGHQRDRSQSPLPGVHNLWNIAQTSLNAFSPIANSVKALVDYWGIRSVRKYQDPITPEQQEILERRPAQLRASQISAVAGGAFMENLGLKGGWDNPMDPSHGFGRKALIDIVARHIGSGVLGHAKWAESVFAQEDSEWTNLGTITEEALERSGKEGMRIHSVPEYKQGLKFKVGDTLVTGTPDFLDIVGEGAERRARLIEVKRYQNTDYGQAVATIQSLIYSHGLTGLAQGRKDAIQGVYDTPEEAQAELKKVLHSWARTAKNLNKDNENWGGFDPDAFAEEYFELLKAGKLEKDILVINREGDKRIDKKVSSANDRAVPGIVKFVNDMVRNNLGILTNDFNTLLSTGTLELPGDDRMQTIGKLNTGPDNKGLTSWKLAKKVMQIAKLFNKGNLLRGDIPDEDDPERSMVQPGETIRTKENSYVVMGDEMDRPGDTTTITDAAKRGQLMPKEQVQAVGETLRAMTGNKIAPQVAERNARLLMSQGISTHAIEGVNVALDDYTQDQIDAVGELIGEAYPKNSGGRLTFKIKPERAMTPLELERNAKAAKAGADWVAATANQDLIDQIAGKLGISGASGEFEDQLKGLHLDTATAQEKLGPGLWNTLVDVLKKNVAVTRRTDPFYGNRLGEEVKKETDFDALTKESRQGTGRFSFIPRLNDLLGFVEDAEVKKLREKKAAGQGLDFSKVLKNLQAEAQTAWTAAGLQGAPNMDALLAEGFDVNQQQGVINALGGHQKLAHIARVARHLAGMGVDIGGDLQAMQELAKLTSNLPAPPRGSGRTAPAATVAQNARGAAQSISVGELVNRLSQPATPQNAQAAQQAAAQPNQPAAQPARLPEEAAEEAALKNVGQLWADPHNWNGEAPTEDSALRTADILGNDDIVGNTLLNSTTLGSGHSLSDIRAFRKSIKRHGLFGAIRSMRARRELKTRVDALRQARKAAQAAKAAAAAGVTPPVAGASPTAGAPDPNATNVATPGNEIEGIDFEHLESESDYIDAAQNLISRIDAGQVGKEEMSRLKKVGAAVGKKGEQPAGMSNQAWKLGQVVNTAMGLKPEAFSGSGGGGGGGGSASGVANGLANLPKDESLKLISDLVKSIGGLTSHTDGLEKAMKSQTDITKDQVKATKKSIEVQESIGDKAKLRAQIESEIAQANDVLAGRRTDQLSDLERGKVLEHFAKAQGLASQLASQASSEADAVSVEGKGTRLNSALRSLFGGMGMFYIQRVGAMALGDLSRGYEPNQRAELSSWKTSAALYGQAAGRPDSDIIEYQKALLRSGGGLGKAIQGFELSTTGTALGGLFSSGKAGLGGFLGGMFALSELAGSKSYKGSVLGGAATMGLLTAVTAPLLQQVGFMSDPNNTAINAAANSLAGKQGWSNWMLSGGVLADLSANFFNGNGIDVYGTITKNQAFQKTVDLTAAGNTFLQGKGLPKNADPKTLRGVAQTLARTEGGIFEGIDEDILQQTIQTLAAAGPNITPDQIASVATAMQAGIDVNALAKQAAAASGIMPTDENLARMAINGPKTQQEAEINLLGSQVIGQMGNAYRAKKGITAANQWYVADQMADYAYDPAFLTMKATWNLYERTHQSGGRQWKGAKSEAEISAMTDAEREDYFAGMSQEEQYQNFRERALSELGAPMGKRIAATADYAQQQHGARGFNAAQMGYGLAQQIYQYTGNEVLTNQLYQTAVMQAAQGHMGTMNLLSGVVQGNPVAVQLAMQTSPALQQTMANAGFSQIADVNRQGKVTGMPLWTTNMTAQQAQQVWGSNWQNTIGQYAVNGYTPMFSSTQTALYGIWGAQAKLSDMQYQGQLASFAASQAQLDKTWAFTTGVGIGNYSGTINPQTGKPFGFHTGKFGFNIPGAGSYQSEGGGFWGIEDAQRNLGYAQQEWSFDFQQRQLEMNSKQFYENLALNIKGSKMQRGFTEQDWAYQDQMRALQWQWRQEDFGEEVRFMTGRQRRLAERQMKRDTITHNLEDDRIERQKDQQRQLWKLEDQRFDMQKRHHEEQKKMQQEQIDMSRLFFAERKRLEEESILLQRAYWVEQQGAQQEQLDTQKALAAEIHKAQTEMITLNQAQETTISNFKLAWEYADLAESFLTAMSNFAKDLKAMGYELPISDDDTSGTSSLPPIVKPSKKKKGVVQSTGQNQSTSINNPWSNTVTTSKPTAVAGAQSITLVVNIGNEKLDRFVIDAVSKELSR